LKRISGAITPDEYAIWRNRKYEFSSGYHRTIPPNLENKLRNNYGSIRSLYSRKSKLCQGSILCSWWGIVSVATADVDKYSRCDDDSGDGEQYSSNREVLVMPFTTTPFTVSIHMMAMMVMAATVMMIFTEQCFNVSQPLFELENGFLALEHFRVFFSQDTFKLLGQTLGLMAEFVNDRTTLLDERMSQHLATIRVRVGFIVFQALKEFMGSLRVLAKSGGLIQTRKSEMNQFGT
jgi:hypothetical protein